VTNLKYYNILISDFPQSQLYFLIKFQFVIQKKYSNQYNKEQSLNVRQWKLLVLTVRNARENKYTLWESHKVLSATMSGICNY
jgi:hypothetical protein